jgi:hypothetical protein
MLNLKVTRLGQAGATQVDWGNALTQGLICAVNMATPGLNMANLKVGTSTTVGTINNAIGSVGKCIQSASGVLSVTNESLFIPEGPVTHFLLADITALDNPYGGFFAVSDAATNGCFSIQREGSSSTNVSLYRDNGLGKEFSGGLTAIVGTGLRRITCSSASRTGTATLYVEKTKTTGTTVLSSGTVASAGVSARYFGERAASTSFNADGNIFLHLAWNRVLEDSEVYAIHNNPWQIFR